MVDTKYGGRVSSLVLDGRELLIRSAPNPLNWGLYPMVPFAGRVRNGLLRFDNEIVHLPTNMGPHAIHGYGFIREWTVLNDNTIQFEFGAPWPFAGRATQTFDIGDASMTLLLRVEADERQPVQIGWHPWFRRDIGVGAEVGIGFEADAMFELDDAGIPTGDLVPVPSGPWDDCFSGLHGDPTVSWGDRELTLSSSLAEWTIYNGDPSGVCVEPQLGPPNSINSAPVVVEAGEAIEGTFTISW